MKEFGNLEIRTRIALYSIIEQANEIEFELNDILAWSHFNDNISALNELNYLSHIEKQLQKCSLACKCKQVAYIVATHQKYTEAEHECLVQLLDEWRRVRNCIAHGILVINSSQIPVFYHNGTCYKIDSLEKAFYRINGILIKILSADAAELKTPYSNRYPSSSPNNDPDHPRDWASLKR